MKKFIVMIVAVIALGTSAMAQSGSYIGARLGAGNGTGVELSYMMGLGSNRAEFDLGINLNDGWQYIHLAGIYQWNWNITGGLGWYAGVGPRVDLYTGAGDASIGLGVCGQAGVDYHFDAIPLQLSLDIRPCFYVYPGTSFQWGDIALGIRYMF